MPKSNSRWRGGTPARGAVGGDAWLQAGLALCLFLTPPLLALLPRGAAPLAAVVGILAFALVVRRPGAELAALTCPAALLAALVAWGGLSALWSIVPGRSLLMAARLTGLAGVGLSLAAAARIVAPRPMARAAIAGMAVGIALAFADLATGGGLTRYVSVRAFADPRLNPAAAWAALLVLPIAASLAVRGRRVAALVSAAGLAAAVLALADTTAKVALAASLPTAGLFYWRRGLAARVAAVLSVLAILSAPLTLPKLAQSPRLFATAEAVKASAGHRLLIWSFAGSRIAERPVLGWGLDAARAIPGGRDDIRPGEQWLPLHPHDGALQVWLELGAPGAVLLALVVGWLWLALGGAAWPRVVAAAAAGSLAAGLIVAAAGWGIWEEWWIATLEMATFAVLVLARAAIPPPRDRRAGDRSGPAGAS